jgi:hypothetical protein
VLTALKASDATATLRRTEFVGPQVGDELAADGLKALAFVVVEQHTGLPQTGEPGGADAISRESALARRPAGSDAL